MSTATLTETRTLLSIAARSLAGRCNHASTHDGAGFSKFDADFGHRLADTPAERWSDDMSRRAWKMLRKYRGQLASAGINFDTIPQPSESSAEASKNKRQVTVQGQILQIRCPYDPDLIRVFKQMGATWDGNGRAWLVPASLPAVQQLADQGFEIADDARERAKERTETAAAIAQVTGQPLSPTVVTVPRIIAIDGLRGGFSLLFPYDQELVNECRATPGCSYDRASRTWNFPYGPSSARAIRRITKRWPFILQAPVDKVLEEIEQAADALDATVREAVAASQATDAELEIPRFGVTPRPFQRAGIRYMARCERVINGDDMGLGKTIQALGTLELLNAYPCVVVVPRTLKLNWKREAMRAVPHRSIQVLNGNTYVSLMVVPDITIVHYDVIHRHVDRLKQLPLQGVVADEAHLLKNPKARRTLAVLELTEHVNARVRLALTGTPVLNRVGELEALLKLLGRLDSDFGGQKQFRTLHATQTPDTYGVAKGSSNLIELNTRLRATCFVRRLKADVLTDLPAKEKAVVTVELSNRAEYERAEAELIAWLREQVAKDRDYRERLARDRAFLDSIKSLPRNAREAAIAERVEQVGTLADEAEARARRAETLVRINALRQLAALGKIDAVKEWVENFLESGEKLVLFAWHRAVINTLREAFPCDVIDGGTPEQARQAAVDRFQNDPAAKLLLLNIKSGGVGLTLTAARNVAIVELPWTPGDLDQAIDRCHRIGQTGQVTWYLFLAENTIDEHLDDLQEKKRAIVTAAADGIRIDDDEAGDMLDAVCKRLLGEPLDEAA